MRRHYERQQRFDCTPISELVLNTECRDEVIPILTGLQYVYSNSTLRNKVVKLIADDINEDSRRDVGRPGFDDWQIIVLSAVRLGCNYDYDKLEDQAENHRALRTMLGINNWEDQTSFSARRIRDTLCEISPDTIEAINHAIVRHGQELHGTAAKSVRADSFVVETNIHHPTESNLIKDGMLKIIPLCVDLAREVGESGWRQNKLLRNQIKNCVRKISLISSSKSSKVKTGMAPAYTRLLERAASILDRAKTLQTKVGSGLKELALAQQLKRWIELTQQVCDTAYRRFVLEEDVPNCDKLFSLFETHTQLYRRGKAATPNQWGRLVLVFEDGAGFISHYSLMDRDAIDSDVIIEEMQKAQKKHKNEIETGSFDRGFYTLENLKLLESIIGEACLPPRHPNQFAEHMENASVEFHRLKQRHAGIESAIGALQSGNGLKRSRDRSEVGFERYLGLAILGRNIHVLGKLLIAQQDGKAAAAISKRKAA